MIQHFHETYEGSSVDLKIEKYIYVIYIIHIMYIYIYKNYATKPISN